jgi:hypothetical protein
MPRIKMVQDGEADGLLAEIYTAAKAQSLIGVVAEILKTMSLRPDFLAAIEAASRMQLHRWCAHPGAARDHRSITWSACRSQRTARSRSSLERPKT